jgi:SAM-dependent methyltransferase
MPVELFMQGFNGNYTAIDLSSEHLNYLQQALNKFPNAKNKVHTITGRFPQDTKNLKSGSFDIIIITHVFHFFEPQHFDQALTELNRLLAHGGKIYLTAKTPYSMRYRSFIPVYEQRVREHKPNPGYIDNVAAWVDPATITS